MRLFKKAAIVGLGLIGGSMALAIKKKKIAQEVIGVSRRDRTLSFAKMHGMIDAGSRNLDLLKDADLVILAAPVGTILRLAPQISRIVRKDSIVIDVGSTKKELVAALEKLFPRYIGTHPLAGSEKRGVEYAQADIFKGSLCILTPTSGTDNQVKKKIQALWEGLEARTISMNPALHDKILAFISHLPHVASFSLMGAVPGEYLKYASTGLKDTTRLSGSDSSIWTDILLTNRRNIIDSISALQDNLLILKKALQAGDRAALDRFMRQAKKKRESLG